MEIVRGMKVVPHIPLVLSKIVIYIQTSCALTLSYPAVGEGKLQARAVLITLKGEDGRIQVIAPPYACSAKHRPTTVAGYDRAHRVLHYNRSRRGRMSNLREHITDTHTP